MKQSCEDLYTVVFSGLKDLGVKVPKVKKFKSNIGKQDKCASQNGSKIFGVNLCEQEWISDSDCPLPKFVVAATTYLQCYTQAEIGLFRKAGSIARQRDLRAKLEKGGNFEHSEPNDVASLLKQWLRELPEPVIPVYLHDLFIRCESLESEDDQLAAILMACLLLPSENLYTLKHLLKFLSNMAANSDVNKMGHHNLAVIMAPNLLSCGGENSSKLSSDVVQRYTSLVELLIINADKVGEVPEKMVSQLSSDEGGKFPIDSLESSPYVLRKKVKNGGGGGVSDLVNGIRKFVGNNLTPLNNGLERPDLVSSHRASIMRSAKHKSDPDVHRSSLSKKKTVFGVNPETRVDISFLTPIGKSFRFGSSVTPLNALSVATPVTHRRRKSFGLLGKKKSKAKTNATSKQAIPSVMLIEEKVYVNEDVQSTTDAQENKPVENEEPVAEPCSAIKRSLLPLNVTSQRRSIKRAQSDRPVNRNLRRTKNLNRLISSSEGSLSTKRPSSSPLMSNPAKRRPLTNCKDTNSPLNFNLQPVEKCVSSVNSKEDKGSPSHGTDNVKKPIAETSSEKCGAKEIKKGASIRGSRRTVNAGISSNSASRSSLKKETQGHSAVLSQISKSSSGRGSERRKKEISQCAFNTASEAVTCSSIKEMGVERASKTSVIIQNTENRSFTKTNEMTPSNSRIPDQRSARGSTIKSSLKRGRPNTIRTGLPSELCPKYSNDVKPDIHGTPLAEQKRQSLKSYANRVSPQDKDNLKVSDNAKRGSSMKVNKSCGSSSFHETVANQTPKTQKGKNMSSVACLPQSNNGEKTRVFPENDKSPPTEEINSEISDGNSHNSTLSSKPSGSKIDEKPIINIGIKTKPRRRGSSTSISILTPSPSICQGSKEETSPEYNIRKAMNFSDHLHDSQADTDSFVQGEENWISDAESFLSAQNITLDNQTCKRESVIQIMIKNAGKVQANVERFNQKINDTPKSLNKVTKTYSTPVSGSTQRYDAKNRITHACAASPFSAKESQSSKICSGTPTLSEKEKHNLRLTRSETRVPRTSKYRKSPVPPPPKFFVTGTEIISATPLKEVTNTIDQANCNSLGRTTPVLHAHTPLLPVDEEEPKPCNLKKKDSIVERFKRQTRVGSSPNQSRKELRSGSSSPLAARDKQSMRRSHSLREEGLQTQTPSSKRNTSLRVYSYASPCDCNRNTCQCKVSPKGSVSSITELHGSYIADERKCEV